MTFSECTPAGHSVSAIQLINNVLLQPAHRATQDDRTASASACVREMCQAPKSGDKSLPLAEMSYAGADGATVLCRLRWHMPCVPEEICHMNIDINTYMCIYIYTHAFIYLYM